MKQKLAKLLRNRLVRLGLVAAAIIAVGFTLIAAIAGANVAASIGIGAGALLIIGGVGVIALLLMRQSRGIRAMRDELVATRRVLDADRERLIASSKVLTRLHTPLEQGLVTKADLRSLSDRIQREGRRDTAQVESYLQLLSLAPPRGALPATRGWAASADYLLTLVDHVIRERPSLVVDLGSGLTTVFQALAMEQHGIDGRIVAIDHDAEFAAATRELLVHHGVAHRAEVRHAPITEIDVNGTDYLWYSTDVFDDLESIDLLSVDGPPGSTQTLARFPALPMLEKRLAPRALVAIDDADRDDETEMVARWTADGSPWKAQHLFHEKGCVLLHR